MEGFSAYDLSKLLEYTCDRKQLEDNLRNMQKLEKEIKEFEEKINNKKNYGNICPFYSKNSKDDLEKKYNEKRIESENIINKYAYFFITKSFKNKVENYTNKLRLPCHYYTYEIIVELKNLKKIHKKANEYLCEINKKNTKNINKNIQNQYDD